LGQADGGYPHPLLLHRELPQRKNESLANKILAPNQTDRMMVDNRIMNDHFVTALL
jgi:hypothetical protein